MKKNNLKRISSRILFWGVLFLSNLSLISIGFSAWSIVGAASAETQIQVSAADVIDLNQYFTFVDSPTIFEYTSDGLVKDYVVGAETLEGYIKIPFRIDVKSGKICDHLEKGKTGFLLRTILVDKNQNLDLYSVCTATEVVLAMSNQSNSFSDSDYSIASSSDFVSSKELNSTFDLSTFSYLNDSLAYFSVKYKIKFNISNFKTDVYDKLSNGSFRFSFKAGGIFDNE